MKITPRSLLFACLTLAALAPRASAQLDYAVLLDEESKTWTVRCELANPSSENFEFWLARWTAGAYHRADYGRFVNEFEAFGEDGQPLKVERQGETHFEVQAKGQAKVSLRYKARSMSASVYADGIIDVEANRIMVDYAYLNPVSLLGFVPGRLREAHSVRFGLPKGWRTATVLEEDVHGVYHTPSFYRLEDSPFLFSPGLRSVELEAGGKPLTVSAHGLGEDAMNELVDDCYRIVEACSDLFGGLPYEHYEFLFGFVPEADGSGLEHSYSTLILFDSALPVLDARQLSAHEFFHLYCAERIHVQSLQEPDYTRVFETGTLWVNESITEYMSLLLMMFAEFETREQVLAGFTEANASLRAMADVGRLKSGPEASRGATDWKDIEALISFSGSLYLNGSRTMFALDMEMRRGSAGKIGILHLLKHLLSEYVDKGRGFPEQGMRAIISEVAGHDLGAFYDAHIDQLNPIDMNLQLEVIGYGLQQGKLIELPNPTPQQLAARSAYFSMR